MKEICNINQCTGCGLCSIICPKKSIVMKEGFLGHLYPAIDQETCIDCKICQKKCPTLNPIENSMPKTAYAAWAKDEIDYKTSTSGAASSVLAQHVIKEGGVVYGCTMLPNIEVKHIRIDSASELYKIKGSKYVQSSITEVLPQIKNDVNLGIKTLFIGTPCQVAAVSKLFNTVPINLILVDLICHGVPSEKILKTHVNNVARYDHYDNVIFRDGNGIYVVVVVDGKEVYRCSLWQERFKDFYINAFMDAYTYRDSCYSCQYAKPQRISDITIGDFWGLSKTSYIPEHKYGCSLILPSTEKGSSIINAIRQNLNIYERPVQEAIDGNHQLRHPAARGTRVKLFRRLYTVFGRKAYRIVNADIYIKKYIKKLFNI